MKKFVYNNCAFYVGRNAKENWDLLNRAEPHDMWVHLADRSSPYVIIVGNTQITMDDILYGCDLCKKYSHKRDYKENKIKMNYTEIRNVKKGKVVGEAILDVSPSVMTI